MMMATEYANVLPSTKQVEVSAKSARPERSAPIKKSSPNTLVLALELPNTSGAATINPTPNTAAKMPRNLAHEAFSICKQHHDKHVKQNVSKTAP